jgi:hypothetical protein
MIEITFLPKDTIGIIATSFYQVGHGRCITIYFFVLWVNLLVLCFQGRVTYVLFRRCHTFIRHRPFYWKGWGLRFFKEDYPKLFELNHNIFFFLHLNGIFLVRSGREGNKKALRNNLEIKKNFKQFWIIFFKKSQSKKKKNIMIQLLPVKFECCYPIPNMDI